MTATVTRWIEFDAGHRVARHQSQCRHLHGHRYRLTVEVAGPIVDDDSPAHGMVIDFGAIKDALTAIHDSWDHRFLLGIDDPIRVDLEHLPGVVILDRQPTAENLATLAHARLVEHLAPLDVVRVTVDETAKCAATIATP